MIDTTGLPPAQVLAGLFNASKPQGLGFMQYDSTPMSEEEAAEILNEYTYFDYLQGRVMKVNLKNPNQFEESNYDRDNGSGAARSVISSLRDAGYVNPTESQTAHKKGVRQSAALAHNRLDQETRVTEEGDTTVVNLGLSDVKDKLKPAIDKATKHLN